MDMLPEYLLHMDNNRRTISEDHIVPGFLDHDEANGILKVDLSMVVVIMVVNHMTCCRHTNC